MGLLLAFGALAAEKKGAAKVDRLSGRIQMVDKNASTITLDTRNNIRRTVIFGPNTTVTYRNRPGTMDQVKEGRRVIVLGKFNQKAQLVATRIDVRESGK
ncbi:MAG: hypothetical protein M1541_13670 [Acidobacteria bacterium]|nr:hypothetical protein [Acidobacteriota bacterium]